MLIFHLLLVLPLLELELAEVVLSFLEFFVKFLDLLVIVSLLVERLERLLLFLLHPDQTFVFFMQVLKNPLFIFQLILQLDDLLDVVAALQLSAHLVDLLFVVLDLALRLFKFRFLLHDVLVFLSLFGHEPFLLPFPALFNEFFQLAR
jgi:hypothetical protein